LENLPDIGTLHNQFSGRIFMLGTGASLLNQGLHCLTGEQTFVCNGFPKWADRPFSPTFYGVSDIVTTKPFSELPIGSLDTRYKFNVQWASRAEVHDPRFIFVEKAPDNIQVHSHGLVGMTDTLDPVPTGRTTPLTLVSVALWMGFREFYFLGVEQYGGYVYEPDATRTMQGHLMERHERYYKAIQRCFARARADVEAVGGRIVDCTPGGFLTGRCPELPGSAVLPYERLEDVLA
jgi:hypothetical protein